MILPESSDLFFFVGASLLLIIAPGPDIIFLITQGITRGARAGLATAMGLASGNLVHTLGAALGVSVIFRASAFAFQSLKIAGVVYLLFLAWKAIRERDGEPHPTVPDRPATLERAAATSLFWRGFLMNVLNPKVALFFLAFLPQFASTSGGPIWAQILVLGLVFFGLVVVVFGALGLVSGILGERAARLGPSPRAGKVVGWAVALVYVALAVRLALVRGSSAAD